MNTVGTKELNFFQRFLAKLNIQLEILEDKIGMAIAPPLSLIIILALVIGIIIKPFQPFFLGSILGVLIVSAAVIEIVILNIGGRYKRRLPGFQVKAEKEKLKQLKDQIEIEKENGTTADINTLDRLIGNAQAELEQKDSTEKVKKHKEDYVLYRRLKSIRETVKKLEQGVRLIQAINAKESKIKTIKQEYEKLPQEEQELAELKQNFKEF